jgi:hypothetical protein
MAQGIHFEIDGAVAGIVLDRPAVGNAINITRPTKSALSAMEHHATTGQTRRHSLLKTPLETDQAARLLAQPEPR